MNLIEIINIVELFKQLNGRRFPIDEIVKSDNSVNLNATKQSEMGGFVYQLMNMFLDG